MKCFHPHTYQKLGFDQILRQLQARVSSDEAREAVAQIAPMRDAAAIETAQVRVAEYQALLELGHQPPRGALRSVGNLLPKAELAGSWLATDELYRLLGWLSGVQDLRSFLHQHQETAPTLDAWVNQAPFNPRLVQDIARLFDDRGQIRDDASPALAAIRRQMQANSRELRNVLYRILRLANEKQWSQEREITLRNDRLVIPVKSEARGQVPGFIQDVSQSGGTVFIEPAEALPLNNKARELQIQEQAEIVNILRQATAAVRAELPSLRGFREITLALDLVRAQALLAQELGAVRPRIEPGGTQVVLYEAYYPLLQLKARQDPFEVVPLEFRLTGRNRILVISGPNAGGKSVALKTLGLLQLMVQCGMPVPVRDDSVFRLFEALFLDIGDEQSVDTDLSTYTSRLHNWRQMGDHMDADSLFLIDEFGSGTDPKQGGAIAEAFLERFVRQKAYGLITTHYGNIKDFGEVNTGVRNAAMQFDTQGLRPTYRIVEGMPGRSYAFEMAERVGVHPSIMRRARQKVGRDELDTEALIKELERKNAHLTRMVEDNQRREQKLQTLLEQNESRADTLERERKHILNEAKREARTLIEAANKRIEATIREIRESQAEKERTLALRRQLAASAPEVVPNLPPPPEGKGKKKKKAARPQGPEVLRGQPIAAGDWVKLKEADTYGQLVELSGKRGVLEAGGMRLNVKLAQLEKIRPPRKKEAPRLVQVIGEGEDRPSVRMDLDVLGLRVEEALPRVDKFMDEAHLAGLRSVRILHGKGSGILRDAIRKHLRDLRYVEDLADAPVDQGGAGWTLVEIGD